MAKAVPARIALDEDVRPLLARLLRDRGWDAVSVVEAGRTGLLDDGQLAWAARERRVFVTHNAADFASLATSWAVAGQDHAGVLLVRQGPTGSVLRHILKALVHRPSVADWTNQVVWASRSLGDTP